MQLESTVVLLLIRVLVVTHKDQLVAHAANGQWNFAELCSYPSLLQKGSQTHKNAEAAQFFNCVSDPLQLFHQKSPVIRGRLHSFIFTCILIGVSMSWKDSITQCRLVSLFPLEAFRFPWWRFSRTAIASLDER